jgi:hypothetical protein
MADEENKQDCDQCKFWEVLRDAGPDSLKGEVVGACHRYAPRPYQGFLALHSGNNASERHIQWPETFAYEWCGDFAPMSESGHASPA